MIKHRHKYFLREGDCSQVYSKAWCDVETVIVSEGDDKVVLDWEEPIAWTLKSTTCEDCLDAIGLGMLDETYYD